MFRTIAVMRRNLQNIRKSPRVADESIMQVGNNNGGADRDMQIYVHDMDRPRSSGMNAFSIIYSVVIRAPRSIMSCFSSQPHVSGADGVWMSGDFSRMSEVNHLMVSDSMRYAILM